MFPQVLTEPRASHRPVRPLWRSTAPAYRWRASPHIDIVMGYPPSTVVVRPGGFLSVHAQTIDKVEQGEVTLRQVTYLSRPVIHLSIDVHCPIAAPGRTNLVVPDALQVCRLRSGARTGYQQITTILKVQRDE